MALRILTFVSILLAVGGCRRESAPRPSLDDMRAEEAPSQESWDVRYFVTETAMDSEISEPRVEIRAAHMATFDVDSTYTVMRGDSIAPRVTAYLFDEEGDTSAVLHATRLVLHDKQRRFEATGNVIVDTPEDKRLESEHIIWWEDSRTLETPGFVRIRTPQERVQGFGLVADENLDTYRLNQMTGLVTVEEEE